MLGNVYNNLLIRKCVGWDFQNSTGTWFLCQLDAFENPTHRAGINLV